MRKLLLISILVISYSSHAESNACLRTKYVKYAEAKSEYQRSLTELISRNYPELADVATMYMHDQLLRINRALLISNYLVKDKPDLINTSKKIDMWINVNNDIGSEIAAIDKSYSNLLQEIESSRSRAVHPDGDLLRKVMRENVMLLPEFLTITEQQTNATEKLDATTCQ